MENNDVFVVDDEYLTSIDNYVFREDSEQSDSDPKEPAAEENEVSENETSENESIVVTSGDYTQLLENIQNSLNLNTAALIGCIILIGLLMGLKKL